MSPKSLLRHPLVQSPLTELSEGKFEPLIGDTYADKKKVKRVILCSGKVYYDLFEYQQKMKERILQFYEWNNYILFR